MRDQRPPRVYDLFCGMGGLSYGFSESGFETVGFDISTKAGKTYSQNRVGGFIRMNLMRSEIRGKCDVMVGGPPCEPWSCLNLTRRKRKHPGYVCLSRFFDFVRSSKPLLFVMENVPSVRRDPVFDAEIGRMNPCYDIDTRVVRYSDHGAATARRRLFAVGIRRELETKVSEFLDQIEHKEPSTVRQAIGHLKSRDMDASIDHVWPRVRTIQRYTKYYRTGKFGWYILDWDKPAPSFGNICKTYILHPDSFDGGDTRPISVREALGIVGFPETFRFPAGIGLVSKYEMIADTVSPLFSVRLAESVWRLLRGNPDTDNVA